MGKAQDDYDEKYEDAVTSIAEWILYDGGDAQGEVEALIKDAFPNWESLYKEYYAIVDLKLKNKSK